MGKGAGESDPVYQVHQKYYQELPNMADLVLLENVPEYDIQNQVSRNLKGWESHTERVDPRHFGLGCSRARNYGIALNPKVLFWDKRFTLRMVLIALRAQPMMTAKDFFWMQKPAASLTSSEEL